MNDGERALAPLGATLLALGTALGCGGGVPGDSTTSESTTDGTVSERPDAEVREGVLVAYQSGREVGRERFRDDGRTLTSEISMSGTSFRVSVDRTARRAVVEAGGSRVERSFDAETLVLENGSWQAYALVVESHAHAAEPTPVQVLIPGQGAVLDGTVQVRDGGDGGATVEVSFGGVEVTAEVAPDGTVRWVRIPAQGVEARPEGQESPPPRAAPEGVAEEAVEVTRGGVPLRGVLWRPADADGPVPVVVFVAGSGPTDRDGNQGAALRTDSYRLLAEGLAQRGVASLRYDKRGVGESGTDFAVERVVFEDFVEDARAMVEHARADERLGPVILAGHSEGGLVALSVAQTTELDALALLSTPARNLVAVMREQLARQLDASMMEQFDRVVEELRAGQTPRDVPPPLTRLFAPAIHAFLRSMMQVDPIELLREVRVPVAIIQGETDAQVGVEHARLLAEAQPRARLVLVPRANHLFKEEASAELPQASYTDPSRPIVPAALTALAELVDSARP